jgi:hypothetical protein
LVGFVLSAVRSENQSCDKLQSLGVRGFIQSLPKQHTTTGLMSAAFALRLMSTWLPSFYFPCSAVRSENQSCDKSQHSKTLQRSLLSAFSASPRFQKMEFDSVLGCN